MQNTFTKTLLELFLKSFHRLQFCRELNQEANIKPIRLIQPGEQATYNTGFQFHLKNLDMDHILLLQKIAMTKQMAECWEEPLLQ